MFTPTDATINVGKVEAQCGQHASSMAVWGLTRRHLRPANAGRFFLLPYEAAALNIVLSVQRVQSGKRNNTGKTFVVFDEQLGHDDKLR